MIQRTRHPAFYRRWFVVTAIGTTLLIGASLHSYWPNSAAPGAKGQAYDSGDGVSAQITQKGSTAARAGGSGATTDLADIKAAAVVLLNSKTRDRWAQAFRTYLSLLNTRDLWDVLTAPGVLEQSQSKAARDDLLMVCAKYIRGMATDEDISSHPTAKEECGKLATAGGHEYFKDQSLDLLADDDFQNEPYRMPGPDFDTLSREKIVPYEKKAQAMLSDTENPWVAGAAMRDLWWMSSATLMPDWTQINSLNDERKSQLMQTLATDRECQIVGGCGPTSPLTLAYCNLVTGTQCPVGMSYDEIVQLNLSQVELELRQQILSNINTFLASQNKPHG